MSAKPFWETTPLAAMSRDQWESLCDGCGRCCVHKLEDEETGELFPTNVACRLLDGATAQCKDYRNRKAHVPECVRLTPAKLDTIDWLPSSCAYLRVHRGQGLADWHPLVSGDPRQRPPGRHLGSRLDDQRGRRRRPREPHHR